MDKGKVQKMRISDEEFEMLKSVFADREDLLKAVRNVFFGIADENEKKIVKDTFSTNVPLRRLMRKQFLPEIQGDLPIGQAIDLWMTIDLKDKDMEQIQHIVKAREILIEITEKSLTLLENINGETIDLSSWMKLPWAKWKGDSLIARNQFISHIDQQLATIRVLAGMKTETVEETKKRLLQDSTK